MKKWQFYLILLAVVSLSACSTMTKTECQVANWYDLGYTDGVAGYTVNMFGERAKDCAKHGFSADRQAYLRARKEGLKNYCTKENGYREGANGRPYRGVCKGNLAKEFLPAYQKGKHLYKKKSAVKLLARRIDKVNSDINKYKNEIYRLKKQIIDENDKAKRVSIILDLERTNRKLIKLKVNKTRLLYRYKVAEKELQDLLQKQ